MASKDPALKYHIVVEWPASCRNRNTATLKGRPDLVHRMNEHTKKIIALAESYANPVRIESEYNFLGIRMWFASGKDCYDFIIRQKENAMSIHPYVYVVSGIDNFLNKFQFVLKNDEIEIV